MAGEGPSASRPWSGQPDGEGAVRCAHCGLPVPADRLAPAGEPSFCCGGCRAVHAIIRDAGLDRYYDLRDAEPDGLAAPAASGGDTYLELDDERFQAAHVRAKGELREARLYLEGVHCAACVWLLEKLPSLVGGVISSRLDFGRSLLTVLYDPERVHLSQVARALDRVGYRPHPHRAAERQQRQRAEQRKLLVRVAVAGAAAGNVMLVAIALYAGADQDPDLGRLFRWVSMLVTVPAVLYSGQEFFRGALAGLRAGGLHMDVPVSLALIGATTYSVWQTVTGRGDIYFDSVAMLTFLLLAARYVQLRALRRASDASELLFALTPTRARLLLDGSAVREVPVESVVCGQLVEVRAGDTVPVDGVVIRGQSRIDNALLTGEPLPIAVEAGAEVHAGAQNVSARLVIRTTATGEDTRVGRLLAAVTEAQARRAPVVLLADRMAAVFVLVVLLLAGAGAVLAWASGPRAVMERMIAVLVVTCPCALGLATPLALARALGLAARRGIFVKGADTIEALCRVDRVLLDKTGTLTRGRVTLTEVLGPKVLVEQIAALEEHSAHPFAKAVREALPVRPSGHQVQGAEYTAGSGVTGVVDGERMMVGTERLLREHGVEVGPQWAARIGRLATRGASPVLVARAGQVAGMLAFEDPLRQDSRAAVSLLRQLGLQVAILSGDHPDVVAAVARELDLPVDAAQGGLSPEAKLDRVEHLMAGGSSVAMVGDGVNDAGALAAARVGIAVRGGAELALAAADAFLTRGGLLPLVELVRGSRATLAVVRRNLAVSLVYNVAAASLALAGYIGPLPAAILMPISSFTVVLSSVLARPFGGREARGTSDRAHASGQEARAWR